MSAIKFDDSLTYNFELLHKILEDTQLDFSSIYYDVDGINADVVCPMDLRSYRIHIERTKNGDKRLEGN